MKVIVGFSRPKKFQIFSKLVMLLEKREFSHCFVDINGIIYHASHGSVHPNTKEEFLKDNIIVKKYIIEIEEIEKGMAFINKAIGTKYGFDQIYTIFIMKLLGTKQTLFSNNTRRMICSEFVSRFLNETGYSNFNRLDSITPSDLEEKMYWLVMEKGNFQTGN